MSTSETIAAIATGIMDSGISIIRISGQDSLKVISEIFSNYRNLKPNTIIFGKILDMEGSVLDNTLVSYFKAPNSYTGEDVCEINCHGGKQITAEILELVLRSGARMAEPGEFSKRAFLNSKMDLSQAEAVIDLINSKTTLQTKIAAKQLEGNLSINVEIIRDALITLLAQIEVSIDYPEYDYDELGSKTISDILLEQDRNIAKMIDSYDEGKYIKNGVSVAILGQPNMGKSSLLNALAKEDRAIVTEIPGTTRDIIEETIKMGDIVLNIADTAGIRKTEDIIEKIGVQKSLKKLEEVDLVIYLISADEIIKDIDFEVISKIIENGIKNIVAINKIDKTNEEILAKNIEELGKHGITEIVQISTTRENMIDPLKKKIQEMFLKEDFDYNKEVIIVNKRHKDLLIKAQTLIKDSIAEVEKNTSIDIIAIAIKEATHQLGLITGHDISADVVTKIFEKFCLGK